MLLLCTLTGATLPLPYEPDMPRWQYLAEIISPACGYAVINGTVFEHIISKGEAWTFKNKFDRIGDVLDDGDKLHMVLPLGPFNPERFGNACANGGDASCCAVCLEPSIDMAFECLHFFHRACVEGVDRCPTCRAPNDVMRNAWNRPCLASGRLPCSVPTSAPFY
jgi:hypothetical protein